MEPTLRLAELLAVLSLASDLGIGQPMDYLLRSCLLATRLAERMELPDEQRQAVYYTALLRWVGCTGHAHEASILFGDEITARARFALIDPGSPAEVLRLGLSELGAGRGLTGRLRAIAQSGSAELGVAGQFRASCETARFLAERLGIGASVRRALWHAFERWDGRGVPNHVRGENVDIAARVVLVAQDAVVLQQTGGIDAATEAIRHRAGRAYDPAVASAFAAAERELLASANEASPWDQVLATEPQPQRVLSTEEMDSALEAVADYVDLKSPWMAGHSRGVARLAVLGAEASSLPETERRALRQAGLPHDLGRCGVHNGIWEKAGPLTDAEWERVRLHPYLTGRLLSRCGALASVATLAAAHHERPDGSGYHRGAHGVELSPGMKLLAAADAYRAMTEPRPYRPALAPEVAATELRREVQQGRLDGAAVESILDGAGHRARIRGRWPARLTNREVEVLRLAVRGATNRQTARRLSISDRTVAHHIQHIYDKIGVSTRGAAAIYAMEHDLID